MAGQETECPYCHKPTLLSLEAAPLVRLPTNVPQSPFLKKVGQKPAPAPESPPTEKNWPSRPAAASSSSGNSFTTAAPVTATPTPVRRAANPDLPVADLAGRILDNLERVVIGKRDRMRLALVALFAEGHILLEDVPGVAKTMLARALAQSIGVRFKRVQCTPDLLPTDITGASVFNPKTTEFEFRPGPLFAQFVLADELNRATPRTQSALLEAMAERHVTVDGINYELERPFLIIATQNPIDHEGTFPLPEAQLDRFLVRLALGYPPLAEEDRILERFQFDHPIESLAAVASADEVLAAQQAVRNVSVDPKVRDYLLRIVTATRTHPSVALGASPRASLALFRAAQALAAMQGYEFVLPDHLKEIAPAVLNHRIIIQPEKRLRKVSAAMVVNEILTQTEVPTLPGLNV
jgi:MoxR-like ATPase